MGSKVPQPCPEHLKGMKPPAPMSPPPPPKRRESIKLFGINIRASEVESVTIKRNGAYVTLTKDDDADSPRINGFSRDQ